MTEEKSFDLVIIGAGPGGYSAAVRASQLGLKAVCVEKHRNPGGTCLNVGCIPSKALLYSSELYSITRQNLSLHGILVGDLKLDLDVMMARKDKVVSELTAQVKKLLEANRVGIIHGTATVKGENSVEVKGNDGTKHILNSRFILLATGSIPSTIQGLEFDEKKIVSSTGALKFSEAPRRLGIIGGGYIGLELGSVWQRLGSEVTVIEMLPQIASGLDGQIGRALKRALGKQGISFLLKTRVTHADKTQKGVKLTIVTEDKEETREFDKVLVAVGRKPLSNELGLEETGVKTDRETGHVIIGPDFRTSVASIYAAGDLVHGPMLAHKASAEGKAAVEAMAGTFSDINYDTMPHIIYTSPEVAAAGITEEQAKERKIPYAAASYPFSGNGRARCTEQTEGLVKIISHSRTDRILGVHMIGHGVSEIIPEAVLAMESGASSEDIARIIHGHPTFSETLMEAAAALQRLIKK